jgi:hypothetical protein
MSFSFSRGTRRSQRVLVPFGLLFLGACGFGSLEVADTATSIAAALAGPMVGDTQIFVDKAASVRTEPLDGLSRDGGSWSGERWGFSVRYTADGEEPNVWSVLGEGPAEVNSQRLTLTRTGSIGVDRVLTSSLTVSGTVSFAMTTIIQGPFEREGRTYALRFVANYRNVVVGLSDGAIQSGAIRYTGVVERTAGGRTDPGGVLSDFDLKATANLDPVHARLVFDDNPPYVITLASAVAGRAE